MPSYMHVLVAFNDLEEELSKQTDAQSLDLDNPFSELLRVARFL